MLNALYKRKKTARKSSFDVVFITIFLKKLFGYFFFCPFLCHLGDRTEKRNVVFFQTCCIDWVFHFSARLASYIRNRTKNERSSPLLLPIEMRWILRAADVCVLGRSSRHLSLSLIFNSAWHFLMIVKNEIKKSSFIFTSSFSLPNQHHGSHLWNN